MDLRSSEGQPGNGRSSAEEALDDAAVLRASWERAARQAGLMFVLGWVALGLFALGHHLESRILMICSSGSALAIFSFSVSRAGKVLDQFFGLDRPRPVGAGLLLFFFPLMGGFVMTVVALFSALFAVGSGKRGRQLRRFGKPVLAPTVPCSRPAEDQCIDEVPDPLRTAIAAQWRANAQTEHASIAAFANLSLALISLGAPARLVEGAHRDGLDEIEHAQACFALAAAIDGEPHRAGQLRSPARAPGTFGPRAWRLARLAIDSMVDGALHEGISARLMASVASACPPGSFKSVLRQLAADEARHAAHGWDVVQWCVDEGGEPVIGALLGAFAALPLRQSEHRAAAAANGSWEPYGIPGTARIREAYAIERRRLGQRLGSLTNGLYRAA